MCQFIYLHYKSRLIRHELTLFSMNKQILIAQISNKTYSLQFSNFEDLLLISFVQLIEKHHAKWNPIINLFEIPIQHTSEFIKKAKELDPCIAIKDVPGASLRALLNHRGNDKDSKVVYILPRSKWTRMLVYDPLVANRYEFAIDFGLKKQENGIKRVLVIFWQVMRTKWQTELAKKNISYRNAPCLQFLTQKEQSKGKFPSKQPQFDLLSYQFYSELKPSLLNSCLEKYDAVYLDDSQIWLQPGNEGFGQVMRSLIVNKLSSKPLILFTSRLVIQKPQLGLQIGSLLLPRSFGFDTAEISNGANDANWMKKRYLNSSNYFRELMFILSSLFFVNLQWQTNKNENTIADNYHELSLEEDDLHKFSIVDRRYTNVNRKQVISNFQNQRSIGSYITNNASKFNEGKYLTDLRDTFTILKFPHIAAKLCHFAKNLNLKTIVVVENQQGQQKLQKFMKQQQISYTVYEITEQQLHQTEMCFLSLQNPNPSVYLVVRDKLLQEYRAVCLSRQQKFQMEFQRQAQKQLGIKRGGLSKMNRTINLPFTNDNDYLSLKKINNAHHIFMVDTYWYDFSAEKEQIFSNIIDYKLPTFQLSLANHFGRANQLGLINQPGAYLHEKRRRLVRHYFTVSKSYQSTIVQKYLLNLQAHLEQFRQPEEEAFDLKRQFQAISERKIFKGRNVINKVLDIDEKFTKFQDEVRKQQQQGVQVSEEQQQRPIYNTKIEGLVIETPHLYDLKKLSFSEDEDPKQQLKIQDKNIFAALGQYCKQQKEDQDERSQSNRNSDQCMITEKAENKNTKSKFIRLTRNSQSRQAMQIKNKATNQLIGQSKNVHTNGCSIFDEQYVTPKSRQTKLAKSKQSNRSNSQSKSKRKIKFDEESDQDNKQKIYKTGLVYKNIQSVSHKSKMFERINQSRRLLKGKMKQQKIIARKLMSLRVTLFEGKSSLKGRPTFNEDE